MKGWLDNPEDNFLTNLINQKQTTSVDNTKVNVNPLVDKQSLQPELAQLWDSDALKSKQVYDQKLAESKKQTTVFDKERDSKTLAQNYLNKGNVDRQAFANEQGVQTGQADVMAGLDDPILNTLTFGAAGTIGKVGMLAKTLGAARGGLGGATYGTSEIPGLAYGLTKAGLTKGVETLGSTHKLNPWAFKPNPEMGYRMLGKEGYINALKEQALTAKPIPNAPNDGSISLLRNTNRNPNTGKMQGALDRPYFADGVVDERYASDYMAAVNKAENNLVPIPGHKGIAPSKAGSIPLENATLYKKNWLKGYKEVAKPSIQASKPGVKIGVTGRPIVEKQFTAAVENAPAPNKWLNTTDNFGIMEQGVVKGPPSTQESIMKSFTGKSDVEQIKHSLQDKELFSRYTPEQIKDAHGFLQRRQFIKQLQKDKLIGNEFTDLNYAARSNKKTEDLTKLAIDDYHTSYRRTSGTVPLDGKGRQDYTGSRWDMSEPHFGNISEFDNMKKAGVDFNNPASIAEYQATYVPMQDYGYRSTGLHSSTLNDFVFAAKGPTTNNMYGNYQFKLKNNIDYTTGNYKDWYNKYIKENKTLDDLFLADQHGNWRPGGLDWHKTKITEPVRRSKTNPIIAGSRGSKAVNVDETFPFHGKDLTQLTPEEHKQLIKYVEDNNKDFNTGWKGKYKTGGWLDE